MLLKLSLLLTSFLITINAGPTDHPFYVIANMANTAEALDYAVRSGANAVQMDLRFTDSGEPYRFEFDGACDCKCRPDSDMCKYGLDSSCSGSKASSEAGAQLQRITEKSSLALVIIHAKVHGYQASGLKTRGANVISFVDNNLFDRGYKGDVVIASGRIETYDFIEAASDAANKSKNANRYFFTFENEGDNYGDVESLLSQLTNQRVYGTGISACMPGTYYTAMEKAVAGREKSHIAFSFIWTLDRESSIKEYINRGVEGIVTNNPSLLRSIADNMKLKLATTNDHLQPSKTKVERADSKCDCNYHKGGCTISRPAPPNKACKCYKKFLTACGGSVVSCVHESESKCKNPDESKDACMLGGGNCGGY